MYLKNDLDMPNNNKKHIFSTNFNQCEIFFQCALFCHNRELISDLIS